jgi:hypothetical protein
MPVVTTLPPLRSLAEPRAPVDSEERMIQRALADILGVARAQGSPAQAASLLGACISVLQFHEEQMRLRG